MKKSWHPNTMKNMERVWKAEQKDTEEKKRIAELQREIVAERSKEDFQKFAEDMGVIKKKDDVKLEWMYKGPSQSVNHEEYLLGKAIDKNFERYAAEQKGGPSALQDEESLPGGLREAKRSMFSEQVDIARKLNEDPLMAIRQRAIEKAKQLYNNPVKMKQIQQMAAAVSSGEKKHKKDKKKKKKSKKSSKKDEEKVLDALLTEKLKNALKDRELLCKLKKKAKKESKDFSSSSDSSESDVNDESQRDKKQYSKQEISANEICHSNKRHSRRSDSPPVSRSDRREKDYCSNQEPKDTSRRSRSPRQSHSRAFYEHHSQRMSSSRSREQESYKERRDHLVNDSRHSKYKRRSNSPRPSTSKKRESSSEQLLKHRDRSPNFSDSKRSKRHYSRSPSSHDSDDEEKPYKQKSFGLMMPDGSRPVVKQTTNSRNDNPLPSQSQKPVPWQKKEKLKLSDEEKERRRREMMENANWRDKEREANVKRYRMEADKEKKQLEEHFDDDFARKQFSKAAEQASVEGRIKSKLNTIQRSKMAMDQNFARR